jgi:hypothetical protein
VLSLFENLQILTFFTQTSLFFNSEINICSEFCQHLKSISRHILGKRLVVANAIKILNEFLGLVPLFIDDLFKLFVLVSNFLSDFIL